MAANDRRFRQTPLCQQCHPGVSPNSASAIPPPMGQKVTAWGNAPGTAKRKTKAPTGRNSRCCIASFRLVGAFLIGWPHKPRAMPWAFTLWAFGPESHCVQRGTLARNRKRFKLSRRHLKKLGLRWHSYSLANLTAPNVAVNGYVYSLRSSGLILRCCSRNAIRSRS